MDGARRRVHFVWTGRRFPYYCRLAIESALVAMPECSVELHLFGELPVGRHIGAVARHPSVTITNLDLYERFARCPGGPAPYFDLVRRTGSASAMSNLVRLAVLHERGGVYLDTDVIVLREIHDPSDHGAFVGVEQVWSVNRRRVASRPERGDLVRSMVFAADWTGRQIDLHAARGRLHYARRPMSPQTSRLQVNNAVIGAPPGSPFIERALRGALEVDPRVRYALGPSLLDDVAHGHRDVTLLPPSRFYAIPPSQSSRIFFDPTVQLPTDAMVIHYVASNHRRMLERLDEHDRRFDFGDAPFWWAARRTRQAMIDVDRRARVRGGVG